jgi:hypothetical protein
MGNTTQEGPRLDSLQVQASTEGAAIPEIAGRVRIAGQIIWATKFKEVATTTTQRSGGGKGGGGGGSSFVRGTSPTVTASAPTGVGGSAGPTPAAGAVVGTTGLVTLVVVVYLWLMAPEPNAR